MRKPPAEIAVRRWFRKHWEGWCEFREPARGVGVGSPDCIAMMPDGFLVPVEFKVGWFGSNGFMSTSLRPAQVEWHRNFVMHGGIALIAVGFYFPPTKGLGDGLHVALTPGRHAKKFLTPDDMRGLTFSIAGENNLFDVLSEVLMEEENVLGGESNQHLPN